MLTISLTSVVSAFKGAVSTTMHCALSRPFSLPSKIHFLWHRLKIHLNIEHPNIYNQNLSSVLFLIYYLFVLWSYFSYSVVLRCIFFKFYTSNFWFDLIWFDFTHIYKYIYYIFLTIFFYIIIINTLNKKNEMLN